MATDIGSLSNEELREQLQDFGVNVGPIVSSTRLFYEKKLGKLIDSGGNPPSQSQSEESEEEEEEDNENYEDEEVQFNFTHQESIPQKQAPVPQQTSTPVVQPPKTYTPITQPRLAAPTQAAVRRNVPSQQDTRQQAPTKKASSPQKSGGGMSMWLKLIFILLVAFLVYLVVINMNPSAENRIPLSIDDQQG